jgi:SAM-dependent methyltransferase
MNASSTSTLAGRQPMQALAAPDLAAVKQRQQAAWASGDFAVIGSTLQIVGESLCEAADVCAGEQVLDVAAGNGNATLAAARRFAEVTSSDYVPALLARGRARAVADGFAVIFREADAEALPFPAASFDVVLSTFGVMFAPDQDRAAAEMLRVCRPGGRIGLANWTPAGFIGELFKTIGRHVPPPAGIRSPALWGTEARLQEMFGRSASAIATTRRDFNFRYRSAAHWVEVFRTFYGPVHKAFLALDLPRQAALEGDLHELLARFDHGGAAGLVVPAEYLEVVIARH